MANSLPLQDNASSIFAISSTSSSSDGFEDDNFVDWMEERTFLETRLTKLDLVESATERLLPVFFKSVYDPHYLFGMLRKTLDPFSSVIVNVRGELLYEPEIVKVVRLRFITEETLVYHPDMQGLHVVQNVLMGGERQQVEVYSRVTHQRAHYALGQIAIPESCINVALSVGGNAYEVAMNEERLDYF